MKLMLIAALLTGCAGQNALQWYPVEKFCGVKVCEAPIGESKIDPERDCKCSGKSASQVLQEMQL